MILYFKVGTLPGQVLKAVSHKGRALRKAPEIGQWFQVREPKERYAQPIGVRLLEIRQVADDRLLYVCERF